MKPIVTLSALDTIMTYCGSHAVEAAALIVTYQEDPAGAQKKAKALARSVIASGDIGSMPVEILQGLALWITRPDVVVTDSKRTVMQLRLNTGEKALLQELADAVTDGNMSAMMTVAVKAYAGIDW